MTPLTRTLQADARDLCRDAAMLVGLVVPSLLMGCSIAPELPPAVRVYDHEAFTPDGTHFRTYDVSAPAACDAVRRALMSQGFAIFLNDPVRVQARKFYRPVHGTGVELAMDVNCIGQGAAAPKSSVFIVAWQDQYVTKRDAVTGSVGVPLLGNLSVPVASTEEALVKVGVETVTDRAFYARCFALLDELVGK